MAAPTHPTRSRRSWFIPACAALGVALWLVVIEGCLNPRPDDYPSNNNLEGNVEAPDPPGQNDDDCSGNPLQQDCEAEVPPMFPADEGDGVDLDAGAGDAGVSPDADANASE
jgi:hypothetical protein